MAGATNPILISDLINSAATVEDIDTLLIDQGGQHKKITGLAFKNSLLDIWQIEGGGPNIYFTAGNVGIGTNTPNEQLHVVGNARLENLAGAFIQFGGTTTEFIYNTQSGTISHKFTTGGVELLQLRHSAGTVLFDAPLPTSNPGGSNRFWNNGGQVMIT